MNIHPTITATVITLNEETDLPRCLTSVRSFADEIIVVDSGSSDKTIQIAKDNGAKVFVRTFDNYANQKNYAASKANGEWIFAIDADEVVPPELSLEIKNAVGNLNFDGYKIPRKNNILGQFILHTRWNPELDRHIWLWKKDKGRWTGEVHEEVVVRGKVGNLRNAKLHYQYKSVTEFYSMINKYSELEAKEEFRNGVRFSYAKMIFYPLYNFSVRYFYRKGFLDSWRGFVLSYLMAVYHLTVWIKLKEQKLNS